MPNCESATGTPRRAERSDWPATLVFVGIRGHDAAPLLALPQFTECFAVAAPLDAGALNTDVTLEGMLRRRLDLDTYDYDFDTSRALAEFRVHLMSRLRGDSLVTTYRPSHFLWNVGFASLDSTRILGMFKDRQAAYEYKPWVESEVGRLGLRCVPWRYVADESRQFEADTITTRTVLRASRSAGGVGMALASTGQEVLDMWPAASDHLVALGPYLEDACRSTLGPSSMTRTPSCCTLGPFS